MDRTECNRLPSCSGQGRFVFLSHRIFWSLAVPVLTIKDKYSPDNPCPQWPRRTLRSDSQSSWHKYTAVYTMYASKTYIFTNSQNFFEFQGAKLKIYLKQVRYTPTSIPWSWYPPPQLPGPKEFFFSLNFKLVICSANTFPGLRNTVQFHTINPGQK